MKEKHIKKSASIHIQNLDVPLLSPISGSPIDSLCLEPDRPYTIGRIGRRKCDFLFNDRRVSKRHSQILFDSNERKIYILDGVLLRSDSCSSGSHCVVSEFRSRLAGCEEGIGSSCVVESLNGVFVNGVRVRRGLARELCTGDEVLVVCGNECVKIGFVIRQVVFKEELIMAQSVSSVERYQLHEKSASVGCSQSSLSSGKRNKRVFATLGSEIVPLGYDFTAKRSKDVVGRAKPLLSQCRCILESGDPLYISQCDLSDCKFDTLYRYNFKLSSSQNKKPQDTCKYSVSGGVGENNERMVLAEKRQCHENLFVDKVVRNKGEEQISECASLGVSSLQCNKTAAINFDENNKCMNSSLRTMVEKNLPQSNDVHIKAGERQFQAPGKKFYLNRLQFADHSSVVQHNVVSLTELLHPIETISRIFIATFTSDILWFLSYCNIPSYLPVTIACHNTERCWNSHPDKRAYVPYPDYPNLLVVFPPFPETIAFGKDRRRQGIACHHPKLFVLEREDSIRVIITSANLVANQWLNVTNTIWWQDFPSRGAPDLLSLFSRASHKGNSGYSKSDFAAQLASFMACLLIDVPYQAHWIIDLTKYNFDGAPGHLVASVPGIYSCRTWHASQHAAESFGAKFLGLIEASVVGAGHLFHARADRNGARLKKLATFLINCHENRDGMLEVLLMRNTNVPADANAIGVLVSNPDQRCEGDFVQLGFLPRGVAKWVSPLWDSGFFGFSAYVYPKEVLAAALAGSSMRMQLILYVSQGPNFTNMMTEMQSEHIVAFCSLIASVQRLSGLWRLKEAFKEPPLVLSYAMKLGSPRGFYSPYWRSLILWLLVFFYKILGQLKWPEVEQSDFIYGASSIGTSVNPEFLATFSAAVGKKSLQHFDSEESDPDWGCWTASQESRNPSISIIFPTIERVKNSGNGIWPSRRILCFSEKTWQRLRTMSILHDAVPHPHDRVGHPMHCKVARRRFKSRTDASSYGWIYCGSHNFSAAAWGRQIRNGKKALEQKQTDSSLGLRLHVSNYELGLVFIYPPPDTQSCSKLRANLDDIELPFVDPAPKYGWADRPATKLAMRNVLAELAEQDEKTIQVGNKEEMMEEVPDEEEEAVELSDYVVEEKEEEKAYAEMLWSQVDS